MNSIEAWYDSVEVNDADGTLEGYALVRRSRASKVPDDWEITEVLVGDKRILTPVRAFRSDAWGDLEQAHAVYKGGRL